MRRLIIAAAILFTVGLSALGPVLAQTKVHTVRITVTSAIDGRALTGARITVKGKGVGTARVQHPSTGDRLSLTSYRGLRLDPDGLLVFTAVPGSYVIEVSQPSHAPTAFTIDVPPPGEEGQTTHDYPVLLERNEKLLDRTLTVTVLGRKRDARGVEAPGPVAGARVRVFHNDDRSGRGTGTNERGIAVITSSFSIGDTVRVEVTANGYEPHEQTMVIGSIQDTATNPALTTRTSVEDRLTVTLRPGRSEAAPSLIVEAVRADTQAPVPSATVNIDVIGGPNVAAGVTDAQGRTQPLTLIARAATSETHAGYRAKVLAAGYKQKWSDIPAEMIRPGDPQRYVVHLEPESSGGFQLVEIRIEPQVTTPVDPHIVGPGQRVFELRGSSPSLDTRAVLTVDVPRDVADDETPITVRAHGQTQWHIKSRFFAWLNSTIGVMGRGDNRTNGTEVQDVGSSSVVVEQTVQTMFGKESWVKKWDENGMKHRQFTIGFGSYGTEYGIVVKFTYRAGASAKQD